MHSTEAHDWSVHPGGTILGYPAILPACPACESQLRLRHGVSPDEAVVGVGIVGCCAVVDRAEPSGASGSRTFIR